MSDFTPTLSVGFRYSQFARIEKVVFSLSIHWAHSIMFLVIYVLFCLHLLFPILTLFKVFFLFQKTYVQ